MSALTIVPVIQRTPGVAMAIAYGRQSDSDAIDQNEAIPAQGNRTKAYWEFNLKHKGIGFHFFPDTSAVSARTTPFMKRLAGREIMLMLQPGDHLIIDKIDRMFRSVADFCDVRRIFDERGITLHICNLLGVTVQLGTPGGDLMMNIFVAGAQFESDQVSDRTCNRLMERRQQGRIASSTRQPPLGTMVAGEKVLKGGIVVKDDRRFVWDPDYRAWMGEIVRLADVERKNAFEISRLINRRHMDSIVSAKLAKRMRERGWGSNCVIKHYWREKQYRAVGDFNPSTIKFSLFDPPPIKNARFRDIGRNEPNTPNPYPFLDGKPVPTEAELRKMSNG